MHAAEAVVALREALDRRRWDEVSRLFFRSWGSLLESSIADLDRVLAEVPPQVSDADPRWIAIRSIRFRQVWSEVDIELPSSPGPLPAAHRELIALASGPGLSEALGTAIVLMVAHRLQGAFHQAILYSDLAETLIRAGSVTRPEEINEQTPVAHLQIGITRLLGSEPEQARSSFVEAVATSPMSQRAHVHADAASKLALIAALLGDVTEAEHWRNTIADLTDHSDWIRSQIGLSLAIVDLMRSMATLDEPAAAEVMGELARNGGLDHQRLALTHEPGWSSIIEHVRARYDLLWGDRRAALARLRRHRQAFARWLREDIHTRFLLEADEVDLLLSVGATERASMVLSHSPDHPLLVAGRARLELLTGRLEAAVGRARHALDEGIVPSGPQLQLLVVRAAAHQRLGDFASAEAAFDQAVRTVRVTRNARGLVAVSRSDLLRVAARSRSSELEPFLSRLPDVYPTSLDLIRLSTMEKRVLVGLADGKAPAVLAQQFFLSANTVKSHVHRLYRKLGVTSRADAIGRATELGLIDASPAERRFDAG